MLAHGSDGPLQLFGRKVNLALRVNDLLTVFTDSSNRFIHDKYQRVIFAVCHGHLVSRKKFNTLDIYSVTNHQMPLAILYSGHNMSLMLKEIIRLSYKNNFSIHDNEYFVR